MLFVELVRTSAEVAGTRSRLRKRALLAELLRRAPLTEIELVTAWLSGTLRQRRTGVGWRSLSELPPPAGIASVEVAQVDAVLESVAALHGPGSATARRSSIEALFARLSATEQDFLRNLITGQVRQGALDSVMLEAISEAADVPIAAVRRAAMFSAPTGPVALAALQGGAAALDRFELEVGRPVRPMLAASAPDVPAAVGKLGTPDFVVDTKLDGIRIQVHRRGHEVWVFTRSLDEISERVPEIVAAARSLPEDDLILDGEALLVEESGRSRPFQETSSRAASGSADSVLRPFFFDLLHAGTESYIEAPLRTRLARLDEVVPEDLQVDRLRTDSRDRAADWFATVVAAGQEGVILKHPEAPYDAGRRGSAWIKVKPRHTLDLVVLAVEWGSGRRRGWLSNIWLGARETGEASETESWACIGKTFKGMSDEMLAWQTERFLELETHREAHVVHLRPEQVVEVAFDGVQRSTRYPSGAALRFARVLRYRDDKSADEADTLAAVRAFLPPGPETGPATGPETGAETGPEAAL